MKSLYTLSLMASIGLFLGACHPAKQISTVSSLKAPKAIGPYSQAIKDEGMVYCSGQIGLSPTTGALAGDDIATQTHQVMENLKAVLEEAGTDMKQVVKVTIYLKDLNDYAKVNDIYKDYFPDTKPARSTVQVARLPKDALIEIDCIAVGDR